MPLYRDKVQILLDAVIFLAAFRAFRGEVPYPIIQKAHLLLCVKPVLTVFHNGERRAGLICELADCFKRCQIVVFAV